MFRPQSNALQYAATLIQQGNFEEALHELERVEREEILTEEEQLDCKLLQSGIFILQGTPEVGLQLAEEVLEKSQALELHLLVVDAIIIKTEALTLLGKLTYVDPAHQREKHLQLIEQGIQLLYVITTLEPRKQAEREAFLKKYKGIIYGAQDNLDYSLESLQRSLNLFKEIENEKEMAEVLTWMRIAYTKQGKPRRALEAINKSMELFEKIGKKEKLAKTLLWDFAYLNGLSMGKINIAIKAAKKSLALYEELGNKEGIMLSLESLSEWYFRQGEYNQFLNYAQMSLKVAEEIKHKAGIAHLHMLFGIFATEKGDLDRALEYLHKSVNLWNEIKGLPQYHALYVSTSMWPLLNLGRVHHAKGNFTVAEEYYKKSLGKSKEIDHLFGITNALYYLITLALDLDKKEQAKSYLLQLKDFYSKYKPLLYIRLMHHVSEAKFFKLSPRLKDKVRAQELLKQVVEEDVIIHIITIDAILNLSELLIFELSVSGNEEVLQEIKEIFSKLLEIAKKYQLVSLQVNTILLQAQYEVIDGNLETAFNLIDHAKVTAQDQGLNLLAEKVGNEKRNLEAEYEKWQSLIQRNASLQERLEHLRIEEYLKDAQEIVRLRR